MPSSSISVAGIALRGLLVRAALFVFLIFLMAVLPRLLPGDPFDVNMSSDYVQNLDAGAEALLRQRMGYDGGLWTQVKRDLGALATFDLGYSPTHGTEVSEVLEGALPWTVFLVLSAVPVFLLMGAGLGIEAGRGPGGRTDLILSTAMGVFASIPPFVGALFMLVVFAIELDLLPLAGGESILPRSNAWLRSLDILRHAILPVFALSLHEIARYFFLIRGEASQISRRAFVMNARGRGIGGLRERWAYFGLNLLPVVFARLGHSISTLFGAVLYVEVVFSYPGIGQTLYQAVMDRDFALLQGAIAILAITILVLNWLFDLLAEILARRG